MSKPPLNQELLDRLRQSAGELSRQDSSKSYLQWLDVLALEHGFRYTALKRRVEELKVQAVAEQLVAEERVWQERLSKALVWGAPPDRCDWSLHLPVADDKHLPWPHDFSDSCLFTVAQAGARRQLCGPVTRFDKTEMLFEGEELRVAPDQMLLQGMIMASRGTPCGAVVRVTLERFEALMGGPLRKRGIPIEPSEIRRTLWRLVHCRLVFDERSFDGPLLSYADASRAPDHFEFAFSPAFANFYFPFLGLLNQVFNVM